MSNEGRRDGVFHLESLRLQWRPVLHTNNGIKKDLFKGTFPTGEVVEDQFQEASIKRKVGTRSGMEHFAEISAGKVEYVVGDHVQFAADSGMVFEKDGDLVAVDRDDPLNAAEALRSINERGYTIFVGALSANSQDGTPYTIQSFIKIPLNVDEPISAHPIPYEELEARHKASGSKAEYGYIKPVVRSGTLAYDFIPTGQTARGDLEEIFPYVSGITEESLRTLYEAVLMDKSLAPYLKDTISAFPFNTFKYLLPGFNGNYKDLVTHGGGLSDGGDCNAFTAYLADKLDLLEIPYKVGVYDAARPFVPFAHTDIMVQGEHGIYSCETGLSIPHVIPLTTLPLHPIKITENKRLIADVVDSDVSIYIERESDGMRKLGDMPLRRVIDRDELPGQISKTIKDLVVARNGLLRYEMHDRSGIKQHSFYLDRSGELRTQIGEQRQTVHLLTQSDEEVASVMESFGIPVQDLMDVYTFWIQTVPESSSV